ncbi:MAG: 3-deoxy-manno-octulosonate cytidylyltransferase [Bacteroidales bacterium]|jgi:3-deoxy-manno-octulosonate cytidylyltransferase (CMP-KDO synthetase)|nr:3-deoxy-manno-octulosonate cytidylyltransferase [Bacteroidales bacterium]
MKVLGIIPARYNSTRFPGKPLVMIHDKPMIEHVWNGVSNTGLVDRVIVATEDKRILDTVTAFGGEAVMTGKHHKSGTDRCGEVLEKMGSDVEQYDVVINIQGDEPKVAAKQIKQVVEIFEDPTVQIATLKKRIKTIAELTSTNAVKVVCGLNNDALYFSRQPIPYLRGIAKEMWLRRQHYYKHIGIYAFRREVLQTLVKLPQTPLEKSESLEQLRWMENGYRISVRETDQESVAIDIPEDLLKLK